MAALDTFPAVNSLLSAGEDVRGRENQDASLGEHGAAVAVKPL